MELIKKNLSFLVIIFLSLVAIFPLLHTGFFPMHDNEQVARLFDLDQALKMGQFPPRIAPNLGFGYGYPFFNFYPPFAYYVGEIFHLGGFGFILSTKIMLFFGFFLSGYFMYLFIKEIFGEAAGIVAGAAYIFAPYHSVDIYVRGAFAEFFAFVFLPMIFWASFKLAKTLSPGFMVLTSLSVAFLILSHNLIALMSAPFIAVWLAYLILMSRNRLKLCLSFLISFALGFGLSAYFWIPSYFERNFTLIDILTKELANYNLHFVCIHQLWNSPWGYGGSIPDCNDGLSLEVGKIHLIFSVAALIGGLWLILKKKKEEYYLILLFFVLLMLSSFLTVRLSKPIWALIPSFWYIQFPWRFLTISAFSASFLMGSIVYFVKEQRLKLIISFFLVAAIICFNLSYFRPEKILLVSDNDYINQEKIRWDTSLLSYEYVPKGIAVKKSKEGTTIINISKDEISKTAFSVPQGKLRVSVKNNLPQEKVFSVSSVIGGVLRINTYSFPGWQVFIDGKKIVYSDKNQLKLIDVAIPSGEHVVRAIFTNTPVRSFSNLVSIISIIGLCLTYWFGRKLINEKA